MNRDRTTYSRYFTESGLFRKLREVRGQLLETALLLYLILTDEETPRAVRVAITAVLGYLIWPWDGVPDMLPGIGLTDDLAVLMALLCSLERYITTEMRERAKRWHQDNR